MYWVCSRQIKWNAGSGTDSKVVSTLCRAFSFLAAAFIVAVVVFQRFVFFSSSLSLFFHLFILSVKEVQFISWFSFFFSLPYGWSKSASKTKTYIKRHSNKMKQKKRRRRRKKNRSPLNKTEWNMGKKSESK